MKLKKKSGLMGAVIALSAASLVSVGFASWVISQGDAKTVDGTISVDTVNDERHVINITSQSGNEIKFGALSSDAKQTYDATLPEGYEIWLTSTDYGYESLVLTVSFTVSNVPSGWTGAGLSYDVKAGTGSGTGFVVENPNADPAPSTGYFLAANANLVDALPTVANGRIQATVSESEGLGSVTANITFKWGSAFGGDNPYKYFNAAGKSALNDGDDANTKLTNLKNYLAGVTYQLTISMSATI